MGAHVSPQSTLPAQLRALGASVKSTESVESHSKIKEWTQRLFLLVQSVRKQVLSKVNRM